MGSQTGLSDQKADPWGGGSRVPARATTNSLQAGVPWDPFVNPQAGSTDQAGGHRQREVTATPWPGAGESNPTRHWGVHPESLLGARRALPRPRQRLQPFGQVCMDSARASAAPPPRPLTPLGDLPASTCRAHRVEPHSWVSRASHQVGLASSVLLALWGLLHHRRGWAATLAGAWLSSVS